MQQKETERADDRIDEEFYEELSEEEIQDEIASLYRRRGYMDAETLCRIDREIRICLLYTSGFSKPYFVS